MDVGDVDAKAEKLLIPVDLAEYPSNEQIAATLLKKVPKGVHNVLVDFISRLYAVYVGKFCKPTQSRQHTLTHFHRLPIHVRDRLKVSLLKC